MSLDNIRVGVAGATGYVGGSVLEGLHHKGFWIRALTREPSRLKHPEWCDDVFVGQATRAETLRGFCDGLDMVFTSIGIHTFARKPTLWEVDYGANLNILDAARAAGVRHIIFISSVRAPEMARVCPIAVARELVVNAIVSSGLRYTIYRPTSFFNDMRHVFDPVARHGVYYQIGRPDVRINPLHGLDLADEVGQAIVDPARWNIIRSIGGPEILTRHQIAELAFKALDLPPRIKPVPIWPLTVIAALARPFHYNLYALLKFMEFALQTEDMTGEPVGHRTVGAYFEELARVERARGSGDRSGHPGPRVPHAPNVR